MPLTHESNTTVSNQYTYSWSTSNPVASDGLAIECRKHGINPDALLSFLEKDEREHFIKTVLDKLNEKKQKLSKEMQEQIDIRKKEIEEKEILVEKYKVIAAQCKSTMDSLRSQFNNLYDQCKGNISNLSINDLKIYNNYISARKLFNQANNMIYSLYNSLFGAILNLGKWTSMQILARR